MKRSIVPILMIGLVLASCSGGGDGASTGTDSEPTEESAVVEATDVESSTPGTAPGPDGTATPAPAPDVIAIADLFIPDPAAGLDQLSSYHQEMTLTVTGSEADVTNVYVRDTWPGVGTSTRMTTTDTAGSTELLVGELGTSTYVRAGVDARCEVRWSEIGAPGESAIEPAEMLPPVVAAVEQGADVFEGVAAMRYAFDARIGEATGTGELWLADDSGVLLSYSLDLSDGVVITSYRYAVTSMNALGDAVLPPGCEPVLESIPAIAGATSVQRMTNVLDYATTAAVADVVAFYEQTMPTLGWAFVGTFAPDPALPTSTFTNTASQQTASIMVEIVDGSTWVNVIVRDPAPATPTPTSTP